MNVLWFLYSSVNKLNSFLLWKLTERYGDYSHHKLTFIDQISNQLIMEITSRWINSQLVQPYLVHVGLFGVRILQNRTKEIEIEIDYFAWLGTEVCTMQSLLDKKSVSSSHISDGLKLSESTSTQRSWQVMSRGPELELCGMKRGIIEA